MLKILTNVPIFIWPVFAFLLIGGLKARKTGMVPLAVLLAVPACFFIWSSVSFFGRYGGEALPAILWVLCLSAGFLIGYTHIQKLPLQFDKQKRRIEMPGSWIPLILSMSIFSAKFSLGMMRSTLPHMDGSLFFLGMELLATVILGVFVGRGLGCLYRYRAAPDAL
jgi:hypothetical protein